MYHVAKQPENRYCNYFDYAVRLNGEAECMRAECMYTPVGKIAESVTVEFKKMIIHIPFQILVKSVRSMNGTGMEQTVCLTLS